MSYMYIIFALRLSKFINEITTNTFGISVCTSILMFAWDPTLRRLSAGYAAFRQFPSIFAGQWQCLHSLVASLTLSWQDYRNTTVAGILSDAVQPLQSVMTDECRCSADLRHCYRYEHATPLLRQLHSLKFPQQINFMLSVLTYKYRHGLTLTTHVDGSRGGRVFTAVRLSVFRKISQKPMQLASPNLT